MKRILIIDDEPSAREALRALLRAHPDHTVVAEAGTLSEARARLDAANYDVVLLDIQLRGGSGFDLVPWVRAPARIIFVTAHDEHALRAFTVNALDYLLKPVAPTRLADALSRLDGSETPSASATPLAPDDRVLLKLGAGQERFVRLADVRCICSEENYTAVLVGPTPERLLVRKTMIAWEELLPTSHFLRVHRQTIVNVTHAVGLTRRSESVYDLQLDGLPDPVIASQRYVPALRDSMSRLRP